ncbi:MAG: PIN domain-containing protein [Propionibacteriaceae bacterium]|nr:PIN domain-containing protein [Propionibacteriaceae bacterium]
MRYSKGLLDTSAILRIGELCADDLPEEIFISTITLGELSVGPLVTNDEQERATRQAQLQQVEADYADPLPFDAFAARAFAQVAADIRHAGSKSKARAFDALIAATAKATQLPLYTFNPRDFIAVHGIEIVPLPPNSSDQ